MKDQDLGLDKMVKQLKSLKKKVIQAGILKDAGIGEEGVYIADYACQNEYGTSTIPARPFMSSTFDEKREEWNKSLDNIVQDVLDGKDIDVVKSMSLVGVQMVDAIKEKITSNVPPPLAPSTIARKKSSKTLIDSGNMRSSINFEIVNR